MAINKKYCDNSINYTKRSATIVCNHKALDLKSSASIHFELEDTMANNNNKKRALPHQVDINEKRIYCKDSMTKLCTSFSHCYEYLFCRLNHLRFVFEILRL